MKRRIRLTEGDLHRIVKESVKKMLKENEYEVWTGANGALEYLEQFMDDKTIIWRVFSRIGPDEAERILKDIISDECPENDEDD